MKSFKQYLEEARRNPELNPKISIYKALEPYKDSDDMFITYTADVGKSFSGVTGRNISGFKVGINPRSTYNTPNGVYVYPLKEAWKLYANKNSQKLDVPFAGDEPMVSLLQAKSGSNFVDVSKVSSKDYDRDYMKLAKMIIKNVKSGVKMSEAFGWEYAKAVLELAQKDARDKSPGGIWWNMTRYTFFAIQRFRPSGSNFFTSDAPTPEYKDEVFAMMKDPNMKANFGDMTNRFTNIRLSRNTTKSSNVWTKIFLDLGVDAITDRTGRGIIHPSEPMQGVILNPRAYKVVGSFYNKGYKEQGQVGKELIYFNKKSPNEKMPGAEITQNEFLKGAIRAAHESSKLFIFLRGLIQKFLTEVHGDKEPVIQPSDQGFIDIQNAVLNKDSSYFDFEFSILDKNGSELIMVDNEEINFYVPNGEAESITWYGLGDEYDRGEIKDWMNDISDGLY